MIDFRFTNEHKASSFDEIIAYTLGARLWIPGNDYPDAEAWAHKAHRELKAESKRALVAYDHGQIAGVTIYQRHKEHANAIELKNITVRPDVRGRYVASFLLRNTEIEGLREFQGIDSLLADSKVKNQEIKKFLISNKYRVIDRQDIYQLDTGDDYIYRKTLTA